jgi:hypothetical protein
VELFGIALSIPGAFLLSAFYRLVLLRASSRFAWIRPTFIWGSYLVLGLFGLEIILLATVGAVRSQSLIGPLFLTGHLVVFFLGTPALLNILVLPSRGSAAGWYVTAGICTAYAFVLVVLQYSVSESLFGIS